MRTGTYVVFALALAACRDDHHLAEWVRTSSWEADRPTASAPARKASVRPSGCVQSVREIPMRGQLPADPSQLDDENLIVVRKSARTLQRFSRGRARPGPADGSTGCWEVSLGVQRGRHPEGGKIVRGDRRTPEGWYRYSDRPTSSFAGALLVHYPNAADARHAHLVGALGRADADRITAASARGAVPPQGTALGGDILVHGGGSGLDWTAGCVALDDCDLRELRATLSEPGSGWILLLP